ncbi:oxygen-insensitive NADPH nitroreductase [Alkaliphilus serpentinus]|uniref:Oxygen-insensitive NADPH nitroreductase n=1 Tax=Alkaliphilus serpentinus TaxID=1482731 RepID=A0A833MA47_9FIRM|nr:oxygen-insensitive NADPH nitroreductase [Alkaliphilus serpentinus]KAB3530058.1 oxygen-insensitive NADPH nitroreductase [Alkaliphilus serpentinus]
MTDVLSLIKNHKSIRKFQDRPIAEGLVLDLIEAAQAAPTSSFMQAYSIIRVNDSNKRREIARLSGNQPYIEEAPLFFVFCGDLNHIHEALKLHSKSMKMGYTETFLLAAVDVSLAAQNLLIAAESRGLGGVYIGGIRNNPQEISDLLKIPPHAFPIFGMCLGYPAQQPEVKPRLPKKMIYMMDEYKPLVNSDILRTYDEVVKSYYIKRTGGKLQITWSHQMAEKMEGELRPHMREYLTNQGFQMK